MAQHIGECKLCQQHRPLCRSHVVPELAYAPLKNQQKQLFKVGRKVETLQTGHFERLLCTACENLLARYETVFKRDWIDTIPANFNHLNTRTMTDIIEVSISDFGQFKLFHLSVLWRAAVSSGFTIHTNINLGPYERVLARMLLTEDSGTPGQFPFVGTLKLDDANRPEGTITQLAKGTGRLETHQYYMMSYAFCDWIFFVTQNGPAWLADLERECRANSVFRVPVVPAAESKSFKLSIDLLRALRR